MMIPHWTEERGELREWLEGCPRILIGCDFDGTLAPIVEHAAEAALPAPTRQILERLACLPGVTLVIISGRSLGDIRQRVGVHKALYGGNHGLEMSCPDGSVTLAPGVERGQKQLRNLLGPLNEMLSRVPGVWVEDKHWSASVHYRLAEEKHHALVGQIVAAALEGINDLRLLQGKRVWEIRPAVAWHKGAALACFMAQCGVPVHASAFLGDDVTDLDGFAAVSDGWAVVVGELNAPQARVRLRDPRDTVDFLSWMSDVRVSAF